MKILVLNAGSSSLKGAVIVGSSGERIAQASVPRGTQSDKDCLGALLDALGSADDIDAIGHRVVHGGERFTAPHTDHA